jgi:2,3-bisphosphoglycerate-dependent phosphoglycerate mutase
VEHRQPRFQTPPGGTEFLLVRHGESAPYRPGEPFPLVDGHGDPPLAPNGVAQAHAVADRLAIEHIDAIYVTTLRRTHETAAPLAARLGLVPVVEPELREVHLGEWEGGELRRRSALGDPAFLRMMETGDWGVIPGAESSAALSARCVAAVERLHDAHRDERVALFVHGGVIGAILGHAVGVQPFAFAGADNGSLHHVVVDGPRWHLRCFNDTAHLGPFTVAAQPLV